MGQNWRQTATSPILLRKHPSATGEKKRLGICLPSRGCVRRASGCRLSACTFLGKLAYRQLDFVDLIGREHMKESPMYEEIKDEGRLEIAQQDVAIGWHFPCSWLALSWHETAG